MRHFKRFWKLVMNPVVYITAEAGTDGKLLDNIIDGVECGGSVALSVGRFDPTEFGLLYQSDPEIRMQAISSASVLLAYWPSASYMEDAMWGLRRGAGTSLILWEIGFARAKGCRVVVIADNQNLVPDEVKNMVDRVIELDARPTVGHIVYRMAVHRTIDRRAWLIGSLLTAAAACVCVVKYFSQ